MTTPDLVDAAKRKKHHHHPSVRTVVIKPVAPHRPGRRFHLGSQPSMPVDAGTGTWQELTRPRRESLTEYTGNTVPKVDVTIICDGFPDTPVEQDVAWLQDLGRRDGDQTPVFTVTGPIAHSGAQFILGQPISYGTQQRRASDGKLVRYELTLHLWRYTAADVLTGSSAKKHRAKNGKGGGKDGSKRPKTYVVKKGDTLMSIAAKFYGDASKWHEIAKANGLRDPRHLKVGTKLKLP